MASEGEGKNGFADFRQEWKLRRLIVQQKIKSL